MTAFVKRTAAPLFFIIMLIYIGAGFCQNELLSIFTKPLLLPVLMALVYVSTPSSQSRNIILSALFFSLAGDVFLLFENRNPTLFIPGLVSFLLTHVLYIVYFLSIKPKKDSLLKTAVYTGPLVILYGLLLLYVLFPTLGALKLPVIIYATVIMSMLLASIHIYYSAGATAGKLFIAGAFFFVLSDSLLAINKFHSPLYFPASIMVTYCLAQYLIVKGFILNQQNKD